MLAVLGIAFFVVPIFLKEDYNVFENGEDKLKRTQEETATGLNLF